MIHFSAYQCDQSSKFYNKSSQNIWWYFGCFENDNLYRKRFFLGNVWKNLDNFLLPHLVGLEQRRKWTKRGRDFFRKDMYIESNILGQNLIRNLVLKSFKILNLKMNFDDECKVLRQFLLF